MMSSSSRIPNSLIDRRTFLLRIRRSLPTAVIGLCSVLIPLLIAPVSSAAPSIAWSEAADGVRFGRIEDTTYVRNGSKTSVVLKIDSTKYRFEAFRFGEGDTSDPLTVEEWSGKTGAPVVFNAGQYYESLNPMGLLIKDGLNLGTPFIPNWKGLFVEKESPDGSPCVALLDLKYDTADLTGQSYRFALQSLMLFDRKGDLRVRRSDLVANRTILATGKDGSVFVFYSEGGYTLWEYALFIRDLDLGVEQAIVLDGGYQSQIAVRFPSLSYLAYGKWVPQNSMAGISVPGIRIKLPAIVAVVPRDK